MKLKLSKEFGIDLADPETKRDGLRIWLTGEPGSGKSNAAMRIASQWLQAGRQLIVLDSHGEYNALWSVAPGKVHRIGYGEEPVNENSVDWAMDFVKDGTSLLLDLSHWTDTNPKAVDKFVRDFMLQVYAYFRTQPHQGLVLLEECQTYIPQMQSSGQNDNVKAFIAMLTGGRKFGLNFLLASQRQSLVDVNAVAMCNVRLFMRISEVADWKRIEKIIPRKFPLDFGSKGKKDIMKFRAGEAVVVHRGGVVRTRLMLPDVPVTTFLGVD